MRAAWLLMFGLVFGPALGCDRGERGEPAPPPGSALDAPAPAAGSSASPAPDAQAAEAARAPSVAPGGGAIVEPVVDDPGVPAVDPAHRLDAPAAYARVVLRAALPIGPRFVELVYEGNNKNFRAALGAEGLYRSGEDTAADWRRYAAGVGGLVVLRDSLFSQQDHPTLQEPRALMMPPSWVSVAVDASLSADRPALEPPHSAAALEDDAAWATQGRTIEAYFGSFPVSARLFTDAPRPLAGASAAEQAMTRNARRSLQSLAAAAQAMIDAQPGGAEAVAATGAAWIAASDRSYFGAQLRRAKIIPIFVEHPNEHEARDEGKGMVPWGASLDPEAVALARRAVYGRRLEDGDLALERYDLRVRADQDRALALLVQLVPAGSSGARLWLWVNGGSDGHGEGEPATPYIADFRARLAAADIELSRVVLLSKPSLRPRGADAAEQLAAALAEHAELDLPLSVQLRSSQLQRLLDAAP